MQFWCPYLGVFTALGIGVLYWFSLLSGLPHTLHTVGVLLISMRYLGQVENFLLTGVRIHDRRSHSSITSHSDCLFLWS